MHRVVKRITGAIKRLKRRQARKEHNMGETLKRIRCIFGYDVKQIAEKLGTSQAYISDIENGKREPTLDILQALADIYGIKRSSIMLMAETAEEAKNHGKLQQVIRKAMLMVIKNLSEITDDNAEESDIQ